MVLIINMRILAIDYGKKRTGLAWTDPLQIIATGLGTVDTSEIEVKLKTLFSQEKIEKIVLGYPTHADGNDTDNTPLVRAFHKQLNEWFPEIPVILQDEYGTSKIAMQTMIGAGLKKKDRRNKALLDQVSATIILQQYLGVI